LQGKFGKKYHIDMRSFRAKSCPPITAKVPKINLRSQSDTAGPSLPQLAGNERSSEMAHWRFGGRPELSEEDRKSLDDLRTKIKMYNQAIPDLRLRLPEFDLSLNLEKCAEYYFQVQRARLENDAPEKIAALLTSFQQDHEQEWHYCGWKSDAIADLMLGNLGFMRTATARREAADGWLKRYQKREQKMKRETDIYLSPLRTAATAAAFELEMLVLMDESPGLWIRPGYNRYASLVRWLNRNWSLLAGKKKGRALQQEVVTKFRRNLQANELSDSDLAEVCDVYGSIESLYPQDAVPPSQVILVLVARKHKVSPRLVSTVRAEQNKFRISLSASRKARL
jgi:hypothetical protein